MIDQEEWELKKKKQYKTDFLPFEGPACVYGTTP